MFIYNYCTVQGPESPWRSQKSFHQQKVEARDWPEQTFTTNYSKPLPLPLPKAQSPSKDPEKMFPQQKVVARDGPEQTFTTHYSKPEVSAKIPNKCSLVKKWWPETGWNKPLITNLPPNISIYHSNLGLDSCKIWKPNF